MKATTKYVLALSFIGLLTGTSAPALAAPVLTNIAAVKAAATDHVTEVRYRGHGGWGHRGWGWGGGAAVIGGLALGAALAAPAYSYGDPYACYDCGYSYYGAPYPYYGTRAYRGGYPALGVRRGYWGAPGFDRAKGGVN